MAWVFGLLPEEEGFRVYRRRVACIDNAIAPFAHAVDPYAVSQIFYRSGFEQYLLGLAAGQHPHGLLG